VDIGVDLEINQIMGKTDAHTIKSIQERSKGISQSKFSCDQVILCSTPSLNNTTKGNKEIFFLTWDT
jgi:hypothetical protein